MAAAAAGCDETTLGHAQPDAIPQPDGSVEARPGRQGPVACPAAASLSSVATLTPSRGGREFVRCGAIGGDDRVWRTVLAPRGERLAALTGLGEVRLFDTGTSMEIAHMAPPIGDFDAIAFSPDGTRLAALAQNAGLLLLFRADDGGVDRVLEGTSGQMPAHGSAVTFDAGSRRVATSTGHVADLTTGEVVRVGDQMGWVEELRFAAGGARLFVRGITLFGNGSTDSFVRLVGTRAGESSKNIGHCWNGDTPGAALSPDGALVAVGGFDNCDGGVLIASATTGEPIAIHADWTGVKGFASDGSLVLGSDGGLTLRNPLSGAEHWTLPNPAEARLLGTSPEGWLVLGDREGVSAFDIATRTLIRRAPVPGALDISFTADGTLAAASGAGGTRFQLWRWTDEGPPCSLPADPPRTVTAIAFSDDASTIALALDGGQVELWDSRTAERRIAFATSLPRIGLIALSRYGARVVVRRPWKYDNRDPVRVEAYDADGALVGRFDGPSDWGSVAISPNGTVIAIGATHVEAFDRYPAPASLRVVTLFARLDSRAPVSFSPDGGELAVSADDGFRIHSTADGSLRRTLAPPGIKPYGERLLSPDWTVVGAELDDRFKLWRVADGATIADLPWYQGEMGSPAVTDGGALFASIGGTGSRDFEHLEIQDIASGITVRSFPSSLRGDEYLFGLAPDGSRVVTVLRSAPWFTGTTLLWCR